MTKTTEHSNAVEQITSQLDVTFEDIYEQIIELHKIGSHDAAQVLAESLLTMQKAMKIVNEDVWK